MDSIAENKHYINQASTPSISWPDLISSEKIGVDNIAKVEDETNQVSTPTETSGITKTSISEPIADFISTEQTDKDKITENEDKTHQVTTPTETYAATQTSTSGPTADFITNEQTDINNLAANEENTNQMITSTKTSAASQTSEPTADFISTEQNEMDNFAANEDKITQGTSTKTCAITQTSSSESTADSNVKTPCDSCTTSQKKMRLYVDKMLHISKTCNCSDNLRRKRSYPPEGIISTSTITHDPFTKTKCQGNQTPKRWIKLLRNVVPLEDENTNPEINDSNQHETQTIYTVPINMKYIAANKDKINRVTMPKESCAINQKSICRPAPDLISREQTNKDKISENEDKALQVTSINETCAATQTPGPTADFISTEQNEMDNLAANEDKIKQGTSTKTCAIPQTSFSESTDSNIKSSCDSCAASQKKMRLYVDKMLHSSKTCNCSDNLRRKRSYQPEGLTSTGTITEDPFSKRKCQGNQTPKRWINLLRKVPLQEVYLVTKPATSNSYHSETQTVY